MHLQFLPLVLLTVALYAPLAHAAPLDLQEALGRALEHNPDLRQVDLAAVQADTQVRAAKSAFDPALTGDGSWSDAETRGYFQGFAFSQSSTSWSVDAGLAGALPTGTGWSLGASTGWNSTTSTSDLFGSTMGDMKQEYYQGQLSVGVQQNLLEGILPSYNLRAVRTARQAADRARTSLGQAREQLVVAVINAWQTWNLAIRREAIAAAALESAQKTEDTIRVRTNEGRLTALELGQAELARVQAASDLLQARSDTRASADALLVLMGEEPGGAIEPGSGAPKAEDLPSALDAWVEAALRKNPSLALARADLDAARLAARDAGHATLPSLQASASATLGDQAEEFSFDTGDAYPSVGAGLSLSVPLGNRAARAEADRTTAAYQAAKIQVEGLERSIRSQVQAAWREVETAREALGLAEASAEVSARNASLEEVRFQEGTRTLDRLLDARITAERAALTAASARVNLESALLSLHALVGGAEAWARPGGAG